MDGWSVLLAKNALGAPEMKTSGKLPSVKCLPELGVFCFIFCCRNIQRGEQWGRHTIHQPPGDSISITVNTIHTDAKSSGLAPKSQS